MRAAVRFAASLLVGARRARGDARPSRAVSLPRRRSRSTRRPRSSSWRCRRRPMRTSSRPTCATCASSTPRGERVPFAVLAARWRRCSRASRCARRRSYPLPARPTAVRRLAFAGRRRRRRRPHQRAAPRRPPAAAAPRRASRGGWLIDLGETPAGRPGAAAACACAGRARPSSRPPTAIETSDDLRQWRRAGSGQVMALQSASGALAQPVVGLPERPAASSASSGPSPATAPALTGAAVVVAETPSASPSTRRASSTFAPSAEPRRRRQPEPRRARRSTSTSAARCR